jgi:ATP-dependent RNA helicase DDX3X
MADNQSNARGSSSEDGVNQSGGQQQRSAYVPPHQRNRAPERPSSAQVGDRAGFGGDRGGFGDRGGGGFGRPGGDSRGGFGGAPREGGDSFFGRSSGGGAGGFGGGSRDSRPAPRGDFGNFSSTRPSTGGGFGGGGGGGFGGSSRQRVQTQEDAEIERLFDVAGQGQGINFDQYFDVPVEVGGRDPVAKFEDFDHPGLNPIRHCIEKMGYSKPTPVQQHAVPIAIAGRDLMACAQTGSGKTAAFLFPMICSTLEMYKKHGPPPPASVAGRIKVTPVVLVLAPTRELSSQIYDEARKFTWRTGLRPVCVYGGAEQRVQLQDLDRGCDILIATPGRLVDFMERGKISLEFCRFLCLDEADRMLDMGFEPQIRRIVEHSDMPPTGAARQTLMFSATFPKEIQHLASDFLHDYLFLTVGRVGASASTVEQHVIYVRDDEKKEHVKRQLSLVEGLTLIFVETKRGADALETWLYMQGFNATSIHGDRSQFEREAALKAFKSGQSPVMVATDVAARGLDIPAVSHVINYDSASPPPPSFSAAPNF